MRERAGGKVSTETQRLILRALYDFDSWSGVGTAQAAELLGKPKFAIMRAFDQLAAIDPSLIKAEGKVRWLTPGSDRKSFLQKVAPHLLNLALREYRLKRVPTIGHLPLSGISAINYHADLEDALFPTFAITKAQEKALGLRDGKGLADWREWSEPACVVHVMRYDLDSMNEAAIDPISAILTLSDEEMEDPLMEGAIETILRKILANKEM